MGPSAADPLAALRAAPERSGVFVDFDGTLSPIVPVAADARPLAGVGELLVALHRAYAVVAVVSGRPVAYLADHLPAGPRLVGLYGLEWRHDGELGHHAGALAWQPVVDKVVLEARAALPPAVDVEHKGLSLTLHFRPAPEAAEEVVAWASAAATRTGLHARSAKMSVELHPPIELDKGTVVRQLAEGLDAACYVGDDAGDLPAFVALDDLAARGCHTVKVAVTGGDDAPGLLASADLVVSGPEAALALLGTLL